MYIRPKFLIVALISLCLLTAFGCSSDKGDEASPQEAETIQQQHRMLAFGGGPTGGTFNFFANKMSNLITLKFQNLEVSPKGSGGSAGNLRTLNKNGVDLGIVYAGDAFLGRNGLLPDNPTHYDNVRAVAFLYGAPAQLVVRKDSGFTSAHDLEGKTIAIGNPGSGAALSAERFFKHLGMWDKITVRKQGYSQAAADFIARKVDAFWVLVGYPNSSIIEAASHTPIALINLHNDAMHSGFYNLYPFYSQTTIPAETYMGQDVPVVTFQDSALWCSNTMLPAQIVYECLSAIYSEQGLKDMTTTHKAATDMSIKNGISGVSIPLHPGAVRFWKEQGLDIPSEVMP